MDSYRLGIDIGGTFTDFVLLDEASGEISIEKCLTTGARPDVGVFEGVDRLAERHPGYLARAHDVNHATTLVTNVILERKGARTGLLTTGGFRDILEMGREVKYTVFRFDIRFPPPLVPRELRLGVTERVLADGTVLAPLDEAEVHSAAAHFRDAGVEAVAICFLHAYRNPSHELRAAEILADALPGVQLSLSHAVHPEPKEFERTSTTVVDAYIKSVAAGYLDHFAEGLGDRRLSGPPVHHAVQWRHGDPGRRPSSIQCGSSNPVPPPVSKPRSSTADCSTSTPSSHSTWAARRRSCASSSTAGRCAPAASR